MHTSHKLYSDTEVAELLRDHGIAATSQRVLIARTILSQGSHVSAEELFRTVNAGSPHVSKATVYNTLGVLAEKGLIREVFADPSRVLYDPNVSPHHHFYDEVTGELTDIDAQGVDVTGLPPLPEGAQLQGVDVIVRLRSKDR